MTDTSMPSSRDARTARHWLSLAIGVLLLAGFFAGMLVVGRTPPFDRWITDPQLFKRCLVVHVNLSLVVWFYAFIAGILSYATARHAHGPLDRAAPLVSATGVALLGMAAAVPGAQPVLSNYVPMIDHPLFGAGLVVFGGGVLVPVVRMLLPSVDARSPFRAATTAGLRATATALLLAALTFAISFVTRPVGTTTETFYELLFWGGGHVLQLCSALAMMTCWLLLLGGLLGRAPLSATAAKALFSAMVVPWFFAPVLAATGTQTTAYRVGFTQLMQLGIFPGVVACLAVCVVVLVRARKAGELGRAALRDPRFTGFAVSAGLALLGFVLGAMIRGSNTMVPAHYHASIGAVTAAFMAATWGLLGALGLTLRETRLGRSASVQPVLYGIGQMVFAAGFAIAGSKGMMRKAYGAEQHARGLVDSIGLGIMGLGGLIAIGGGVLYLAIVLSTWRNQPETAGAPAAPQRRNPWQATIPIQSNPPPTPSRGLWTTPGCSSRSASWCRSPRTRSGE